MPNDGNEEAKRQWIVKLGQMGGSGSVDPGSGSNATPADSDGSDDDAVSGSFSGNAGTWEELENINYTVYADRETFHCRVRWTVAKEVKHVPPPSARYEARLLLRGDDTLAIISGKAAPAMPGTEYDYEHDRKLQTHFPPSTKRLSFKITIYLEGSGVDEHFDIGNSFPLKKG